MIALRVQGARLEAPIARNSGVADDPFHEAEVFGAFELRHANELQRRHGAAAAVASRLVRRNRAARTRFGLREIAGEIGNPRQQLVRAPHARGNRQPLEDPGTLQCLLARGRILRALEQRVAFVAEGAGLLLFARPTFAVCGDIRRLLRRGCSPGDTSAITRTIATAAMTRGPGVVGRIAILIEDRVAVRAAQAWPCRELALPHNLSSRARASGMSPARCSATARYQST